MDTIDLNKRRLIQACGVIGSASVLGLSLSSQAKNNLASLSLADYDNWDMSTMASLLREGQVTPLELTDAAISRFEANAELNVIAVNHFEMARAQAIKLSKLSVSERAKQMESSPLLGVPFALKDLGV
ncbi:MAG: hypothetical protein RPR40_12105, partial [Bermanella sp.]